MKNFPIRLVAYATLLAWLVAPLLAHSRASEVNLQALLSSSANYYESAEVVELTRVIDRIENSSDVVVFRLQLAANDSLLAQSTRPDSVNVVLGTEPGNIAVLYPNLDEPYRGIFIKIIEGVEAQIGKRVVSFAVGGDMTAQVILANLKRHEIKVVIALGRQGLKAASGLVRDYGVVVGGVVSAPEDVTRNYPVISLAPDPGMLFERLKHFMPNARRVVVVYDPRQNGWLIRLARQAARRLGLELQAVEVMDLKSAVRAYQELLASVDPKKDALWLPQDPTTVEETSVLPLVLEGAWNLNLAVFSSNVTHVRRGALFSLYPNNVALGRQLAASALNYPAGVPSAPTVVPMKDALLAVNVRTASHLGMQLSSPMTKGIDLVFPAQ